MPPLSKPQLLLKLAKPGVRTWDELLRAWNALYDFLRPTLERQVLDLEKSATWIRFHKICNDPNFPEEQLSAAKLSKRQVIGMMASICLHHTNRELEQFEILSLSTDRQGGAKISNDDLQNISSASLLKQQCLSSLSQSQDRKWNNLLSAWDALEHFIKPRLDCRVSKLPSDERLEKWRHKEYYPFEQMLALNLSTDEVNMFMRTVCFHISNAELGLVPESHEITQPSIKRPREDNVSDDNFETIPAPEPVSKRAKPNIEGARLPVTTKIYFMEENNENSRTGILVTLLSNVRPENDHVDINTLRYGNATHHLAKRGTFEKHKHQLFYYDLENRNVRINVDTVGSFRAAVEEMFKYRTSESRIEFCFRLKEGLTRLV